MRLKVDRDRLLNEGYLILRGVVPRGDLSHLRAHCESLLEMQKVKWAADRGPDDPPGGEWETASQPRVIGHQMAPEIDESCIAAVEIWNRENVRGVSSELLGVPDAGVTEMMMMCSPVRDHGTDGHRGWHRDVYPPFSAPIQGYTDDIVENGPRYVQWNIPLYDDDVLWVVPGSHRRLNTEAENEQLRRDERVPLPGGVQTRLEAGDGVVYIMPILHWGSRYDAKIRRTLHGGFSLSTQQHHLAYAELLTAGTRQAFERWNGRSEMMVDLTERALRAAIERDVAGYYEVLDEIHPGRGPRGQALTSIFLSKTARSVYDLRVDDSSVSDKRRRRAAFLHPTTFDWGEAFAGRFSAQEAEVAWERFRPIDEGLQTEEELAPPAYEDRPARHFFYEMPGELDVGAIVEGWARSAHRALQRFP